MEDSRNSRSTPSSAGVQRPSLHRRSTVDEYVSRSCRAAHNKPHHHKTNSDASVSSKSLSNHNNSTRSNSKNRSGSKTRRNGSRRHSRTTGQSRSLQKKQQQQRLREVIGNVNREVDLDEDDTILDWESSSVYNTDAIPTNQQQHNHHHHSQNNGSRRHSRTTGHRSTLQKKQQKQLQQAIRDVNRELATMDFGDMDAALEPTHNYCHSNNNNNSSRRHSRSTGHRGSLQKKQQQQLQQVIQDINKDMTVEDADEYNPWEAMIDTGIPETKVTLHRVSDVDDDVLFHADFSCCASGNASKSFQQGPSAHTRSTHTQSTHTRTSFSTEGSQETEDLFLASPAGVNGKSCSALDFDGDNGSTDFFSQLASASTTKNLDASQAFIQDPTELPPMISPRAPPKASVASKYSSLAGRVALKSPISTIAGAGRRRTCAKGQPLASRDGFRTSSKKTSAGAFVTDDIMMLPSHQETNQGIPTSPVAKDKSKSFHPRTSLLASSDITSSPRPRRRNSLGTQLENDGQQHSDAKITKDQQHHSNMWSLSNLVAMTMPHGKLSRQKLQPRHGKQAERGQHQETLRHNFFGDDGFVAQQQ